MGPFPHNSSVIILVLEELPLKLLLSTFKQQVDPLFNLDHGGSLPMLHFSMLFFFCVSNIKQKRARTPNIFGVVLVVFLFSLSNIVILLLVEFKHRPKYWTSRPKRRSVVLLSCLSFNKVGPPSSRRGTRQPTLWKMTLRFNIYKECRIGKAFFSSFIINGPCTVPLWGPFP